MKNFAQVKLGVRERDYILHYSFWPNNKSHFRLFHVAIHEVWMGPELSVSCQQLSSVGLLLLKLLMNHLHDSNRENLLLAKRAALEYAVYDDD